jgi:hypothetical protein
VHLSFTQLLKTKSSAIVLVNKAEKDLILIKAILKVDSTAPVISQYLHYFLNLKEHRSKPQKINTSIFKWIINELAQMKICKGQDSIVFLFILSRKNRLTN